MGAEKIGMEAVEFTGSRTRGEGAEENMFLLTCLLLKWGNGEGV